MLNVPGRKTDVKDSRWLTHLLVEVGLLRGSFIPPKDIAAIREVTRYRKKLIQSRTSELQRLGKVLEDAGVMIDSGRVHAHHHVCSGHDRGADRRRA